MDFWQAIELMLKGKKVVCDNSAALIYWIENGKLMVMNHLGEQYESSKTIKLCTTETWSEYKEPGHGFHWALDQLLAGKRVTRQNEIDGEVGFVLGPYSFDRIQEEYKDAHVTKSILYRSDYEANDWILAS